MRFSSRLSPVPTFLCFKMDGGFASAVRLVTKRAAAHQEALLSFEIKFRFENLISDINKIT